MVSSDHPGAPIVLAGAMSLPISGRDAWAMGFEDSAEKSMSSDASSISVAQ